MEQLPIIIGITVFILLIIVGVIVFKKDEKFTNSDQGRMFDIRGMRGYYGDVTSNPNEAETNRTWAAYDQLKDISASDNIPFNAVLPNMMHLPPLRDIYNTPVRNQKIDPVSGLPVSMYTSPRVPLTDFKSETTRDYQTYQ